MSDSGFTRRGVIATTAAVGGAAVAVSQFASGAAAQPVAGPIVGAGDLLDEGARAGAAGEVHQAAIAGAQGRLTTNQGLPISDDQNSLKAGARGPVLLEDFILREKINHFDHERIPERVVHARGAGAHGYFELTSSLAGISRAEVLSKVGLRTPVFVRFSTVAGNRGSADLARDVRGFAVKFYTREGVWDLVGNNIPVFFIQDAIKFPDIIHAVKEEPDRGFPQAASAHDTFWDFTSLTPESMHMIMWVMSDRGSRVAIRMIEGFGVHTFRLVNDAGKSTYVKFHWRPKLGLQSVVWDEAVKINGADPDFHRRDLWNNIDQKNYPEWELAVQTFDEDFARKFDFDVLDATKLIPEEVVPLRVVGRMVLDQNPTNVFAETEQVAFCTSHVVPGIDFTNDPLLQGRNFSYLDTQLTRLGGPNFHQIPINQTRCPMQNFQRDGHMQMSKQVGRVSYEPSALPGGEAPREDAKRGFRSFAEHEEGDKLRVRSPTFADHYSQARQFFLSQTPIEQTHIVKALTFELSKVEAEAVRGRVLGQLVNIDSGLAQRVADGLAWRDPIRPASNTKRTRTDLAASPTLSILRKAKSTFETRVVGIMVSDGADAGTLNGLRSAVASAGGVVKIVAPKIGGVMVSDGSVVKADYQLAGGPSVLFDAVAVVITPQAAALLSSEAPAVGWVQDAFSHLKVIGFSPGASALIQQAGVKSDAGVVPLSNPVAFVAAASRGRIWDREPTVRQFA